MMLFLILLNKFKNVMKKLEKRIYYALNLGDNIVKLEIVNYKQEFWEEDVYEF